MTEEDYIQELRDRWPKECEATLETIARADEAVHTFPQSSRLWVMRGNLIELGPEACPHPLEEALSCYQRAVELDPQFTEAWEEIGAYYDAVLDDEATAEKYFLEAARLKGADGQSSGANAASPRR